MPDLFDEYPDYDFRGDERYHSPPDQPGGCGIVVVGVLAIECVVIAFAGVGVVAMCMWIFN